jgi:N-carbamoylputrescine amidase
MKNAPSPFVLGALQMQMSTQPAENLAKAIALLEQAAKKGVQVAVLPELFMSPYFCQSEDHAHFALAEEIPGPTTEALAKVAKAHKMVIVASLFERRTAGMYHNTTAVLDADGSLAGIYRKMHIPDDPLYYEKFYFTPGDLGFKAIQTAYAKIGVLICWDQWFPEAARLTALQGADVLCYPTAIGWHPAEKQEYGAQQVSSWQTIQRSHAIANGLPVCAVNRIGHESGHDNKGGGDGIEFFGHSFLANPYGTMVAEADDKSEAILTMVVDPALTETARQHWPFFRDRRIDAYAGLTKHPS